MHPVKCAARELPVDDGDTPHQRAHRRALHESDQGGSEEKTPIPQPQHLFGPPAKFERDSAKNQAEEQQQDRDIKCAEKYRVDRLETPQTGSRR